MASTIFNQSTPDLVKMYMTARSRISSIMGLVRPEQFELFALESEKNAIFDFVYTLASTVFIKSASDLVKILMTIRSRMSLIMIFGNGENCFTSSHPYSISNFFNNKVSLL